MSKFLGFGFAAVVFTAVIGVDYKMQADAAGVDLGNFGYAGYKLSVIERYEASQQPAASDTTSLLAHLPAPRGDWQRELWTKRTGEATIDRVLQNQLEKSRINPNDLRATGVRVTTWRQRSIGSKKNNTYIYYNHDEVIEITVRRAHIKRSMVEEVAARMNTIDKTTRHFAKIGGLDFAQHGNKREGAAPLASGITKFREYSGWLGKDVIILVGANAKPQSVKNLLARINYDGMRNVLRETYASTGSLRGNTLPQVRSSEDKMKPQGKRIRVTPPKAAEPQKKGPWQKFLVMIGMAPREFAKGTEHAKYPMQPASFQP